MHDAFPDLTALQKTMRSVIRAEAEHTFTRERDREFLEELVTGWVSQMPARQAAGAPDAFAMAR